MTLLFCHGIHDDHFKKHYGGTGTTDFSVSSWDPSRHTGGRDVPTLTIGDDDTRRPRVFLDTTITTVYMGIAINGFSGYLQYMLHVNDTNGDSLFRLDPTDTNGSFNVYDSGGNVVVSANDTGPGNEWQIWTWKIVISDTVGSIVVWRNQIVVAQANDINTGITPIGAVGWSPAEGSFGAATFEDFWVDDAVNHLDARVASVRPDANGTHQDWLRSNDTVAAYTLVNNAPTGDESTYIISETSGQRSTFDVDAVPSDVDRPDIAGVRAWATAEKTDTTDRSIANSVLIGGIDYDGTAKVVDSKIMVQHQWNDNPDTGVAWTSADVDAAEFGVVSS